MSQEAMHEGAAGSPLAEIETELRSGNKAAADTLLEVRASRRSTRPG